MTLVKNFLNIFGNNVVKLLSLFPHLFCLVMCLGLLYNELNEVKEGEHEFVSGCPWSPQDQMINHDAWQTILGVVYLERR